MTSTPDRAPTFPEPLAPTRTPTLRARRRLGRVFVLAVAVLAAALAPLVLAVPSASAVPVTGRAFGFLSPAGDFWLGSWRLADGTLAFCVNTERGTPNGGEFSYADGAALGWYSADDAARLAYISRSWAGTTDPTTAAAGQIATWTITGLGRHTQEELAAKAGVNAGAVLDRARRMLDETERSASRSVRATLDVSRDGDRVRLTPALIVDAVASGEASAPPGSHEGTVTLTGATFDDGSTTARVRNAESAFVRLDSATAITDVSASVRFDGLGYGNAITVAVSTGATQNLLTAGAASASATAAVTTVLPSERAFQPVVSTQTSAALAAEGASISDTVTVGIESTPTTLTEWPVFGPPGGPFTPIPVTVRSRLLGPFAEPIVPAEHPPVDAPVTCEVSLVISTGPGEYVTPECPLAGPGYYVWVETISPADTSPAEGSVRILPWASPFGVATEITMVQMPAPPAVIEQPDARPPAPTLPETGNSGASRLHAVVLALALLATGAMCLRGRHSPLADRG